MIEYGIGGRLRGACLHCTGCRGWTSGADGAGAPAAGVAAADGGADADADADAGGAAREAAAARGGGRCGGCGCAEAAHEDVTARFAAHAARGVPLEALHWSQLELELWRDTDGLFRPRGRPAAAGPKAGKEDVLVSVVCPTTGSRRCFHRLLFICFTMQAHDPKELVVIDTCEDEPSDFFVKKMKEDERILYQHFRVPERRWSIGLKRNLGCYMASGEVIAHFDDDDMYGRDYLETMVGYLRNPKLAYNVALRDEVRLVHKWWTSMGCPPGNLDEALASVRSQLGLGKFGAACAKLSCWRTYTLQTKSFCVLNAVEDSEKDLYGWGFSFVYLRSAWLECPFAHMGLGEDYDFVQRLRLLGRPVLLVHDPSGICAHTVHLDNTSGGNPASPRRYGSSALLYSSVANLVGLFEQSAKGILAGQQSYQSERGSLRQV